MTEDGGSQQRPWWASPSDQLQEPSEPPPVPTAGTTTDSAPPDSAPPDSARSDSTVPGPTASGSDSTGSDSTAADSTQPPGSPRYGADPYLGAFPYAKPENGAPTYTPPPVYTVPEPPLPSYGAPNVAAPNYAEPTYSRPPSYPPPGYGTPPVFGTPPVYGTSPGYSAPPAYGAPPTYSPPTYAPASPTAAPYNAPAGDPRVTREGRRAGWLSLLVVAAVAALVGALVAGGLVAATKKNPTQAAVQTPSQPVVAPQAVVSLPAGSVAQIAATLLPSVVSIIVTTTDEGDEGTGIILTADGEILTNNHVVEGAATSGVIAVTLNDGRTVKASIVGRDPTTDLAVIKAAGVTGLHPASLGTDSALVVGQQVIAIGSPLGLSNTVTSGIVSSLNRPVCTQSCDGTGGTTGATPTVLDAIQTDAAINPGNSGGPLVDMTGHVVGVNSAIATLDQGQGGPDAQSGSIGVGFSIPIDEAQRVVGELEKTGHASHAVLGIGLQDSEDANLHTPNGAKVVSVTAAGPSSKAGIQVNDIITKFGSRTIVDADSLIAATHAAVPNSVVTITYFRGGQTATTSITLGSAASS
jgi:putative serine protease PepD